MEPLSNQSIVYIIGTTAVGKTDLGIYLAKQLNGEVVSADSIQLYQNINIMSAKVTPEEAQGIPHYMIDVLQIQQAKDFYIGLYQNGAMKSIEDIQQRNKLPIVVGGTMYYVESLLFKGTQYFTSSDERSETTEELFNKLKILDPPASQQFHPNDRRRIMKAVNYCEQTGQKFSEQKIEEFAIRYPKSFVI